MIFHAVNIHGETARHKRAQESWKEIYAMGVVPSHHRNLSPNDPLPKIKDVIRPALKESMPGDVIIWTNDDVSIDPALIDIINNGLEEDGCFSIRRDGDPHVGRDAFVFSHRWLKKNFRQIPDFYQGCPWFDLVLAAMIRKNYGIRSTMENLEQDIPPADMVKRLIRHEEHESGWVGRFKTESAHNHAQARVWCQKNMQSLKLP